MFTINYDEKCEICLQVEAEKLKAKARAERFGLVFSENDFKPVIISDLKLPECC